MLPETLESGDLLQPGYKIVPVWALLQHPLHHVVPVAACCHVVHRRPLRGVRDTGIDHTVAYRRGSHFQGLLRDHTGELLLGDAGDVAEEVRHNLLRVRRLPLLQHVLYHKVPELVLHELPQVRQHLRPKRPQPVHGKMLHDALNHPAPVLVPDHLSWAPPDLLHDKGAVVTGGLFQEAGDDIVAVGVAHQADDVGAELGGHGLVASGVQAGQELLDDAAAGGVDGDVQETASQPF
mmetsp:Transcript_50985/g.115929  ORF Transcript_50985/g.115929 Transcript_50985/m.115929 type:complete len:236 (-) Transcript_50985:495-1202(-)